MNQQKELERCLDEMMDDDDVSKKKENPAGRGEMKI